MAVESPSQNISLIRTSEFLVATGVILILTVMVIPIPKFMLDLLLSFSITFSLVILLVSVFLLAPLDFSVFPSLLLIVTLIRLSLNVASTRIILLHGNEGPGAAGQVIQSFGSFVVGGNFVVGAVIFTILVLINFIVITKGSVRTSEVAARFTLDSIPGKQMSIDADLNAGIISDQEARARRRKLEREADFYGSMDGAIRFVRGDAIAGILITFINIIGGFSIGIFQQGMDAGEAARVYTLLTIGDGLVSQLPALVVSTAAGIVVTRAASEKNLASDLLSQLNKYPAAFIIASAALFVFALIPGMPHMPFFLLSGLAGWVGFVKIKEDKEDQALKMKQMEAEIAASPSEKVESILPLDVMELEVGYELVPLVDAERKGDLLGMIRTLRKQFALDMGFIVPPLHIRDNLQLKSNEYAILIKGVEVARGSVIMGRFLAMTPATVEKEIEGIKTKEPTFGLPAVWITESARQEARGEGYTVVDPATVITTHIKETIKRNAHDLLGRQEVQGLLDQFRETNPKVVEELVPNLLSLGKVQKTLQNLLIEQVSIRDLRTILEQLADFAPKTQDTDLLTEYVRHALSRFITKQHQGKDGSIAVLTLEKKIEDVIEKAIQKNEIGSYLSLEPTLAEKILRRIKEAVESVAPFLETSPIILTSPVVRIHLRRLVGRFIPDLVVLSHGEIVPTVNVKTLKVIAPNAN